MKIVLILTTAAALTACGTFNKSTDASSGGGRDFSQPARSGCLQGVVVNGITGQRLPLPLVEEVSSPRGVAVLVHNELLFAQPLVAPAEASGAELAGEYSVCGFPLDETFPVFVWVDGFEAFEGTVSVASTVAQRTPTSEQADIPRAFPTQLADIKVYPKGTETRALTFLVTYDGRALAGAQVQLQPTGTNVLDGARTLAPQVRLAPQTKTTGASGEVVFEAAQLVLGGVYDYTILPPEGGDRIAMITGSVTVGLVAPGSALAEGPYVTKVELAGVRPTP